MARHERDQKIRRIARTFTYFVIILIVILMFYVVRVWERKQDKPKGTTAYVEESQGPSADSRQPTAISYGMLIN
jgi:cytoskeletal protein RodZ